MASAFDMPADDFDVVEIPRFPCEAPDGLKHWPELKRQIKFRKLMREADPSILVFAIPNAGRRNPVKAAQEGILAGVADLCCVGRGWTAWPELKGYDKRGRPGHLSAAQIRFGNDMTARGHPYAVFFSPQHAAEWVLMMRDVREVRG